MGDFRPAPCAPLLAMICGNGVGNRRSRAIAASAAAESGVQPSLLKKMLPIVAMVAAGYVMKNAGKTGGLGGVFGGPAPAGNADGPEQPQTSGDILGELIGAAGKFLGR